jgi:peptide deformylase
VKRPLCYYGNPILRTKAEPILEITDEIRALARDMVESMDAYHGVGLAAPQVGRLFRMFVLRRYIHAPDGKWELSHDPVVYINPKIIDHSKETWVSDEGCLSIPKLYLPVERPLKISVESTRLDGSLVIEELEEMNARVVLHENDHINGVLFLDRVKKKYLREAEPKLRVIKEKYRQS